MPEIRLAMTPEARRILAELLRLTTPAAARAAVNRARLPEDDAELAAGWADLLAEQAGSECARLADAIRSATGDPAVMRIPDPSAGWAIVRALSAVRLTLRESVFPDVPDSALERESELARLAPALPQEQRHALACYDCFGLLQTALLDQLDRPGDDEIG